MNRSMYELTTAFDSIMQMALDDSMDLDALEAALKSVECDIEEKVYNGIGLLKDMESLRDSRKAEADRLTKEAKVIDERIKRIKEWYQVNLDRLGKDKIPTQRGTMRVQNNPPALVVYDEGKVPAAYYDVVPEHYELAKDRIKAALKNGKEIPGARLTRGRSLHIK